MVRRLLSLVAALWLSCWGARAAFSPGLAQLEALYRRGDSVTLNLRAGLDSWQEGSPAALALLQTWLETACLRVRVDPEAASLSLDLAGEELLGLQQWQRDDRQSLLLTPGGLSYEGGLDRDPLNVLLGAALWPATLKPEGLEALKTSLAAAVEALRPFETPVRRGRAIPRVGSARARMTSRLSAEAGQALWARVSPALLAALGLDLSGLVFEGEGTFSRLLDASEQDLGLQFSGPVSWDGGGVRKASLLIGSDPDKGFHLSLKLPAEDSRDDLTLSFSSGWGVRGDTRYLEADLAFSERLAGEERSMRGLVRLKSEDGKEGEQLGGLLRLDWRNGDGAPGRLSLRPALLVADGRLSGEIGLEAETGGKLRLAMRLMPMLQGDAALDFQVPPSSRDLDGLDASEKELERLRFLQALEAPIGRLLQGLPQAQYRQLLHMMGRGLWLHDEATYPPAPLSAIPDSYVVHDTLIEEVDP
ncbi:MAG: hypothetical protein AB9880_06885 [Christensenellales bacterium]